jgi:hypothetical protein
MRKLLISIAYPFLPRPVVALDDVNADRVRLGKGRRNYDGRFIKPYRVR